MNNVTKRIIVFIQEVILLVFLFAGAGAIVNKLALTETNVMFYLVVFVPIFFMVRILSRWGSFE